MIISFKLQIFLIILSCIFFLIVFNSSVKKKISVKYSILWFLLSIAFIIMAIYPNIVININEIVKIREPIHTVFLFVMAFMLLLIFTYNYAISKLVEQNRLLIQEVGMIKKRINDLEAKEKGEEK